MKKVYCTLFVLHLIVGLGAMAGGIAAILNPQAPLGMPATALKNGPFSDFLIPGIILFIVIGCSNMASAAAILFKTKFQGYLSGFAGGALAFWIFIQCILLFAIHFLHILFFIIGVIQLILAAILAFHHHLFPTDIIIRLFNRIKEKTNQNVL